MQQRIEHEFDAYDNEALDKLSDGVYRFATSLASSASRSWASHSSHGDRTLSFTIGRPGHHFFGLVAMVGGAMFRTPMSIHSHTHSSAAISPSSCRS